MPLDRGFLLPKIGVNMSENEGYGLRLEKKIDNMQADIRRLSDHVTCLTFIHEAQQTISAENKKEL